MVRLAEAGVKMARAGIALHHGEAFYGVMVRMQWGILRRLVIGLLFIGALALAACSDEPTFTEAEKTNARYITLAFREVQQAVRISN